MKRVYYLNSRSEGGGKWEIKVGGGVKIMRGV
jgi:hypothetical protein